MFKLTKLKTNNGYFIIFSLIFCFAYSCRSIGAYQTIQSMNQVLPILEQCDATSLVIFDVDEVLIRPGDRIHLPKFFMNSPGKELKTNFEKKAGDRIEYIWSKVMLEAHRELTEACLIPIIDVLRQKGVKIIALTKLRSGPYGIIPSLEHYRFEQLIKLGIDFRSSFNFNYIFTELPFLYDNYPVFYNGIICTNDCSKGETLGAFLDRSNFQPQTIIFFDDLIENVKSVEQEIQKRAIEFYGFHYCFPFPDELDTKIAQFQLNYLHEHEQWLSEQEAASILFTINI